MTDGKNYDSRPDELLALRCQLGERAAFEQLIRRWGPRMQAYARRMSPDAGAADDLLQDIWLAVISGIGRLREAAKLRSWMFGIAHRRVIDRLRASASSPIDVRSELPDRAADEDDSGMPFEPADIEQAIAQMPVVEREALSLFYLDDLSLNEVVAVLGVPLGTVKSRLHRARKTLKFLLTAEEQQP